MLEAFCRPLLKKPPQTLALDTEFVRHNTYFPKLCLLQVCAENRTVAVDPLLPSLDLAPLLELIAHPKVIKIFHACSQDLEILQPLLGQKLTPVFDTQIAAMLTNPAYMPSYQSLVQNHLSLDLPKEFQRYPWNKRPLSDPALIYALNDVYHLPALRNLLRQKLRVLKRSAWMREEMQHLEKLKPQNTHYWKTVKGWNLRTWTPQLFTLMNTVAQWREDMAQKKNLPRQWILKDGVLLETLGNLKRILQSEDTPLNKGAQEEVLALLNQEIRGNAQKKEWLSILSWPDAACLTPPKKGTEPDKALFTHAQKMLQKMTESLALPGPFFMTQNTLKRLVLKQHTPTGWRKKLLNQPAILED